MAWIESHTSLARHPKTIRLAKLLELSMPAAIGHLHLLWWWALEYAEEGDLSEFDPQEVAEAGGFLGDGEAFVSALRRARFLDDDGHLHDWDDYAGRLLARRHTEAERLRRWRAEHRDEPPPPSINKPDETRTKRVDETRTKPEYETRMSGVTVPNRTVPNRTVPNRTGDERARARARPGDETKETFDELVGSLIATYGPQIGGAEAVRKVIFKAHYGREPAEIPHPREFFTAALTQAALEASHAAH